MFPARMCLTDEPHQSRGRQPSSVSFERAALARARTAANGCGGCGGDPVRVDAMVSSLTQDVETQTGFGYKIEILKARARRIGLRTI